MSSEDSQDHFLTNSSQNSSTDNLNSTYNFQKFVEKDSIIQNGTPYYKFL